MTNLDGRLKRLEAQPVAGRYCQCTRRSVDYRRGILEAGGDGGPEMCPACGLPVNRIPIVLTVFDYADGPHELTTDASGKAVFDYGAAIAAIAPGGDV